ncbi:MAG: 30S ribosomal protein S4e, partial [Candidatus Nanoarchaeia archaeon]
MAKLYHISRLNAPKSWPIARKGIKWVAKPIPGPHSIYYAMPLNIYLRDILGLASITKHIKKILNDGSVKVNGKVRKELNFPVGLFDVLSIAHLNKHYRVIISENGLLKLIEISASDAKLVPAKIISKTTTRNGKLQINCNNGWNFLADKDDYKAGDVLLFDAEKNKPAKHIKLAEGNTAYIIGGKHVGSVAKLEKFKETGELKKKKIAVLKH